MKTDIAFSTISIDARTEVIKEAVESTLWSLEKTEKQIEFLRERLAEQKVALGHGKWLTWIAETFGEDNATLRKLQRFMQKPNTTLLTYLPDGRETEQCSIAPRSERKTGAVEVVEPGQTVVQPDEDPTPAPPTNRKTAKGSQKVKEADKAKTQTVVPVIVVEEPEDEPDPVDDWMSCRTLEAVCLRWMGPIEDQTAQKSAAKKLRQLADKLDPPTTDGDTIEPIPKASQVKALMPAGLSEELDSAVWQWMQYKQRNADKVYRYKTIQACGKDMKHLQNRLKELGEPAILKMLSEAEQRGWRSWDPKIDNANGKGNSNGRADESIADKVARKAAKLKEMFG